MNEINLDLSPKKKNISSISYTGTTSENTDFHVLVA